MRFCTSMVINVKNKAGIPCTLRPVYRHGDIADEMDLLMLKYPGLGFVLVGKYASARALVPPSPLHESGCRANTGMPAVCGTFRTCHKRLLLQG